MTRDEEIRSVIGQEAARTAPAELIAFIAAATPMGLEAINATCAAFWEGMWAEARVFGALDLLPKMTRLMRQAVDIFEQSSPDKGGAA